MTDNDVFTSTVYPVVLRHARQVFRDEELVSIALAIGWHLWANRRRDGFPPSVYAQLAVRHARVGRDLPGVRPGKFRDIWDHLPRWSGAGDGVADRRPGPDLQVMWREEFARIYETLTEGERALVDAVADGVHTTNDLAEELDVTPGRVSQLRRQVMTKARE